ncbi:hypothetical protein L6164_027734 [Bauhinia variegata]|uniref:Uncharacterized protein n=1 Tax=Bauhinia variegata TaxID=167791 RepID=A0ACB9LVG8_BAUVA|nr:hypothetical protein L6164_027734 [Bauhinia variegata]
MELDDLDAPTNVPSRVSRFAPKSSKLKPKQKLEAGEPVPNTEAQVSSSKEGPQDLDSGTACKKEEKPQELDSGTAYDKEEDQPGEIVLSINATTPKVEPSAPNGAMKTDVVPKFETEDESKQDDPMDEDTAEEVVAREVDVFFSPSIGAETQLYVLQYPLRPCWRPYELDERCEEVRLKPASSEVEVDLSMDIESNNYDQECRFKMTKQTLSTSWKPTSTKGYTVGLLMGSKMHVHPIHAVVQLRPSLEHIDSGGSKRKNISTTGANSTIKIEESSEEKSVAPLKKKNKQMDSSIEQKSDTDEDWLCLKYHGSKSDISGRYLQQMVSQESSPISFTMNPFGYVTSLCPEVSNNSFKSKGPSIKSLLPLSVEERLKKLLIEGPRIHRFSATKHFAPEYSEEELLAFLQKHAILVQGLWAPRSAFLSPRGGIENLARNQVLLFFSKNLKVQASQVHFKGALGTLIKQFLNTFGEQRSQDWKSTSQPVVYWKFREKPDVSFIKLYPNIVAQQQEILEAMEQSVRNHIGDPGKREAGKNNAVAEISQNSNPGQSMNSDKRATNVNAVLSGGKTMSNEAQQAMPSALKKVIQTHKVCSLQLIRRQLRAMALGNASLLKPDPKMVVAAREGHDAPTEELEAALSEVARNIHGCYVLKSSKDDPFRNVVIDMYCGSEPNAKLKKAEIVEAARKILKRDVTNNEYGKVMNELCVSKGAAWVLRSGDGS